MRRLALLLACIPFVAFAQFDPAAVEAGPLDGGKMWLFEDPPVDYLEETYGFRPDEAWFEHAKLAALRMPGCSASFVSPNGLVATNHHCGQGSIIRVSEEGEGLLDNGFYARSLEEERQVPNLYMDQLVEIEDVTDHVTAMIDAAGAQTDAEAAAASAEAVEAVQEAIQAERGEGFTVQVVALYNGGRYSAYTYRRYTDVRLVMAPEARLGYFGGDFDNFTYPRYALDFSFFRIYENGEPMQTEHYFPLSADGVEEDDLVFVIGNPGSTSRGLTVAQLETTHNITNPTILHFLDERIETLQAYLESGPDNPDAVRGQLFGLLNSQKAYRGRIAALDDEYIMARRAAAERNFRNASEAAGDLIDAIAALQEQRSEMANEFRAFR
ncbi:MAG: S46 family peptidase, partial [Rubricoccaceae bacterium]|nr:S46 family peptidase [Rubricoccaceae bacterium]